MKAFVRNMPHAQAMRDLVPHIGKPTFVTWTASGSALRRSGVTRSDG